MNFNKILRSLFGDKSSRDMKLIQPFVEKVKAAYPAIQQLGNDELRQRTKDIQRQVQDSAQKQKEEIEKLKATIEDTPIDERAEIFAQIDKLEKDVLDTYEKALDEVMPEVFAIVKETARRFAENEETSSSSMSRSSYIPFPIIFYGTNIEAERIVTPVTVERIAPTVARAIRIRAPNACSAEPLF